MQAVKDVLIAVKRARRPPHADVRLFCGLFAERGCEAAVAHADDASALCAFAASHPRGAVVVLGGDGTLVGVVRTMLERGCPLPTLGVNYGRVGFLAEAPEGPLEAVAPVVVKALSEGTFAAVPRVALEWEIVREGRHIDRGWAVNDVVLARRGTVARVCVLSCAAAGERLGTFRADGVIASTPAGSSGYTYSAGGSLVHPDVGAISITAVAPFLSHFPNMVLPVGTELSLVVEERSAKAGLTVDGQIGDELFVGDVLVVRGVADAFTMIVPDAASYFRRLKRCGFTFEPGGQS